MPEPGTGLRVEESLNDHCPWSGKPISEAGLTRYRGHVVGFCNPGCRDKFETALEMFDPLVNRKAQGASRG